LPITRIKSSQLLVEPETVIEGMGFRLDDYKKDHTNSLAEMVKKKEIPILFSLFYEHGKKLLFLLKQLEDKKKVEDSQLLQKLIELKIIERTNSHPKLLQSKNINFGDTFEWLVEYLLIHNMKLAANRRCYLTTLIEKIGAQINGADWDILGTFKLNELLWIECKSSHYFKIDDARKFLHRKTVLKPSLAIFLQNTEDDYSEKLFTLQKEYDQMELQFIKVESRNIVGCVQPNIFFLRVNPAKDRDWLKVIEHGILESFYRLHCNVQERIYHTDSCLVL
jgi:hypothetical protein